MTNHAGVPYADPTNTFLTPGEVIRRYRWGRTKGYQMLRSPGFPHAIGGAYRLDTLAAWEDRQLAGGVADTSAEGVAPAESGHPTTPPDTTPDTNATTPGEGAPWSPSTRRPATGRGDAGTNGGK